MEFLTHQFTFLIKSTPYSSSFFCFHILKLWNVLLFIISSKPGICLMDTFFFLETCQQKIVQVFLTINTGKLFYLNFLKQICSKIL